MLTIKFIILLLTTLTGYVLGWFFTEKWILAEKHRLFQFQGFECRPCLSFHIAWVTSTAVSLLFSDWVMVAVGIAFAFALFAGLKIDQKNKTVFIDENHV